MQKGVWRKKIRYPLEVVGLRLLIALTRHLPRRLLTLLAGGLGRVAYFVDRRSRVVGILNLKCTRINLECHKNASKLARASLCRFVKNWLDLIWFGKHVDAANYQKFFDLNDPGGVLALDEQGRPLIFVTFHYGNFEFASLYMGYHGRGTLVVQQETQNPGIGKLLSELRVVGRNRPVGRTGVMLRLLKTLKRGGNIGLLADLTLPPEKPSVIVDFLGLKMCVTRLHVEMAQRTGAPIVLIIARPLPDGRYRIEMCPPFYVGKDDDLQQAAQKCIDQLAEWVQEDPELWLWGYKHFRYLDTDNPAAYPPYAHAKKAFTKKLRQQQKEELPRG
jgi:lauroyl/myristoyl acyltransferase